MSDPTTAYHGGAKTSVAAGKAAASGRAGRMDKVEAALRLASDRGLTSEELEEFTGISHQSMGGILLKLIQDDRIHRPGGDCTRQTRSGSEALICFIGPGKSVGRPPRKDKVGHADLLQRFADALLDGRLTGPAALAAAAVLATAGFKGRA